MSKTLASPIMPPEVRDAYLRTNFVLFVEACFPLVHQGFTLAPNWHIDLMADYLTAFHHRKIKNLIVSVPPRHLKSFVISVCYVAWVLGHDPTKHIICLSYSAELAEAHARKCREIMNSALYQQLFTNTRLSAKRSAIHDFETTRGGLRLATSIGGTLTGRGCDILIVDDPIKPEEAYSAAHRRRTNEFFDLTVWSRLNNKETDGVIIVMQRLHVNDPIAHLMESEPDFCHLSLSAIAEKDEYWTTRDQGAIVRKQGEVIDPRRESLATLQKIKAKMGSMAFNAQYQQTPAPLEGNLVKWDWFRTYDQPNGGQAGDQIIQSWDTAVKGGDQNDYSVCTTWLRRNNAYYLIDVFREKLNTPHLKKKIIELKQIHNADTILIEDTSSGSYLIPELETLGVYPIGIQPKGDKIMRFQAVTPKIEAGQVFLPKSAYWLDDFKAELLAFPQHSHDDQVDSMAQYLTWESEPKPFIGSIPISGLV